MQNPSRLPAMRLRGKRETGPADGPAARTTPMPPPIAMAPEPETRTGQTEKLLAGLLNSLTIGIYIVQDGNFLLINRRFQEISGYSEKELLGTDFLRLVHPDDRERVRANAVRMLQGHSAEPYEYRVFNKGGQLLWVSEMVTSIDFNGRRAVLCNFMDITSLKRAEEALRHKDEDFKSLIENALDLIIIVDSDGAISYASPAIERLLGFKPEEYVGRDFREAVHPDDAPKVMKVSRGISPSTDIRVKHKDGSWRYFEGIVKKRLNNGRAAGVVINARDITERKRADEELRSSRQQLRDLSAHLQAMREEERKQIARDLHDELGQALTALKMELSWLARKLPPDLRLLREKADSIVKVVDNTVHAVQRISTKLRPGILDDLGLVEAIEWQAKEFQDRTGISCELAVSPGSVSLDQDRSTAIFRIFQETLTNVARHSSASRVQAFLAESKGRLTLRIKDDGKGITHRQIADPKSLGLIGIRERALSLGGRAAIRGAPGKGTTVTVTIPLKSRN
ncbi:MAG: PAS domain S-box protein [Chloroflexi bacterium]|nr:PAS domain S-box protein [Chloroflexota bacterium]